MQIWSRSSGAHSSWFSDMNINQRGKACADSFSDGQPGHYLSKASFVQLFIGMGEKLHFFKPPLKWRLRSGCRGGRQSLSNDAVAVCPQEMPSRKRRRGIADERSNAPADGFEVGASSWSSMPQQAPTVLRDQQYRSLL